MCRSDFITLKSFALSVQRVLLLLSAHPKTEVL